MYLHNNYYARAINVKQSEMAKKGLFLMKFDTKNALTGQKVGRGDNVFNPPFKHINVAAGTICLRFSSIYSYKKKLKVTNGVQTSKYFTL